MGYAGKLEERYRARELRAQSWTLAAIAAELDVSKSSVSVWVRDVEHVPNPGNRGHSSQKPHPLRVKKLAELERCRLEAEDFAQSLDQRDLMIFGLALYLGEGAKTEASGFRLANTSSTIIAAFLVWLRTFFEIDESRIYARLYLHEGLDEDVALAHWVEVTGIPLDQFQRSYRAVQRGDFKTSKHVKGCLSVGYADVSIFRRVMAMSEAVSSAFANPG